MKQYCCPTQKPNNKAKQGRDVQIGEEREEEEEEEEEREEMGWRRKRARRRGRRRKKKRRGSKRMKAKHLLKCKSSSNM